MKTAGGWRSLTITSVAVTGKTLAGADVERHTLPAPRVDLKSQRHKGFRLRVGLDAWLVAITAKLTAHHILRPERANSFQHLGFFVPQHLDIHAGRRLHRNIGQNLQQMVLHDVAERARAVVKIAATLDTEVFRHRDLHAFDELPIPQRLEKRIGKAEKEQVLHRVFAQVVVDAKNVLLP